MVAEANTPSRLQEYLVFKTKFDKRRDDGLWPIGNARGWLIL